MEGIGAEVSQKIRSAIKAKFKEIGLHVDEELPDYVMVMVANKRSKEQMDEDLQLFLGKHTSLFTTWLHQVLQKLQEVTVAKLDVFKTSPVKKEIYVEQLIGLELYENRHNIGGKRKLSDEPKKKKKSKQDPEQKEIKKKIKEEPEDKDSSPKVKDSSPKVKDNRKEISDQSNDNKSQGQEPKTIKKQKSISKKSSDETKEIDTVPKNKKQKENSYDSSQEEHQKTTEETGKGRSKSLSVSSQMEEDDDDCINIRTDGELLDTAEDINIDDSSKKTREKENLNSRSKVDKRESKAQSPARNKEKTKLSDKSDISPDKSSTKEKQISKKLSPSPSRTPPRPDNDDKVIDARELLNRKKAAKKSDNRTRSRSRSREMERSLSPVRKRREDERDSRLYREERTSHRRLRDEERDSSRKYSKDEERNRKSTYDRVTHTGKRKDDWPRKLESDKLEQRNKGSKRESSVEPPPKRVMLDRSYRNKNDDWATGRTAKVSDGRNGGTESPKRKDPEDGVRRPTLGSRVVARTQEPEEDDDVPGGVPSVVKVTPRPRRPPSQQPSSTLIMRAISEANKSLANVPQRPDSTQEDASEAVSHSDAAKALNTVIRYVKQTDKSSTDLKVFLRWHKKSLSALDNS